MFHFPLKDNLGQNGGTRVREELAPSKWELALKKA